MPIRITRLIVLMITLLLGACGFHLREQTHMPFSSLYLNTSNPNTPFIAELQRRLEASQVNSATSPDQAEVVLNIVSEISEKQILSLGSNGRVNGFRLILKVSLRAYDLKQRDWIPAEEMALRRDYSYDDTIVLAKEAEEALLYQSMRSEMAQQIVLRLSRAKPLSDDREQKTEDK